MENIKPFETQQIADIVEYITPYLSEVRRRLLFIVGAFVISTISGFIFYEEIIGFLIGALSLEGVNIVFTSPFQFINLAISCGIATGLVVAFPILVLQILIFLRPALRRKEFKMIVRFMPFSFFLFLVGFIFGVLIMKWQIEIFLTRSISLGIGNILDVSSLLSTVLLTSVLMGIGFQFPVLLLMFMRIGIVDRKSLSKARPWVYLLSFVFVLFLPPDSLIADVVLSLPFILLFEITLFLGRIYGKKK